MRRRKQCDMKQWKTTRATRSSVAAKAERVVLLPGRILRGVVVAVPLAKATVLRNTS